MNRKIHCTLFLCLLLFTAASLSLATVNPLTTAVDNPAVTESTVTSPVITAISGLSDKDLDANRGQNDARVGELTIQVTREAVTEMRNKWQSVATPEELDRWEMLTSKLIDTLEYYSTTLYRFKNARSTSQSKINEMNTWSGFSEKPPYSIFLVDSLRDTLSAKKQVLGSLDIVRNTIESEVAEYSSSFKDSTKQVRLAEEDLEKNVGKPGEQRSRWLLLLAELSNDVNEAGVINGETRRLYVKEMLKGIQADIEFISKKLAIARANYRFTAEELKQKLQSIDEQLAKLGQKMEQNRRNEMLFRTQLDAVDAEVNRANALPSARGRTNVRVLHSIHEQKRLQLLFEDAGMQLLIQRGLAQLLKQEKNIWEQRYRIAGGGMTPDVKSELMRSRNEMEILKKWKDYIVTKLNSVQLLIKSQQEALSSITLSAVGRDELRATLAIYQGEEDLLQRGILFINNFEQFVSHRDEEMKNEKMTVSGRVRGVFDTVSTLFSKFWLTELYVAEETLIVEGSKITRPRSVTIGKVVQAVLILLVGIWVIRNLRKPLHWIMASRFKISAVDEQLYTRLLNYLMFIIVLISSLVFVNIPLAVFTFFGGALAIGIGFGAQALISNFISGLILMFDRTIRMGDVVEVDGHRGRVAAIGMRSSSVKRFDGVEMLVPNSLFLQQNVINWTSSDPCARYTVSVGVAYGSPTKIVERVIFLAVEAQSEVLRDPAPYIVFESFGDSSLNFTAYFWIEQDPEINSLVVFSEIRHRIGERLADAGISIPFPQRDLHLTADKPLEIRVIGGEQGEDRI